MREVAEPGLEPRTPDSRSQASSHLVTALTSAGTDPRRGAAPEHLKPEQPSSVRALRDCRPGGAGWVGTYHLPSSDPQSWRGSFSSNLAAP